VCRVHRALGAAWFRACELASEYEVEMKRRTTILSFDSRKTTVFPNEKDKTKSIDLTIAKDCKEFLNAVRFDDIGVKEFRLENGKTITVDTMNDSELVQYANQMYFDIYGGKDGGGPVDTNIRKKPEGH
jgi:hypothetical protein